MLTVKDWPGLTCVGTVCPTNCELSAVLPDATLIERALVAVPDTASVTRTVKLNVPVVVGVPLIVPLLLKFKPGGSDPEPDTRLQV